MNWVTFSQTPGISALRGRICKVVLGCTAPISVLNSRSRHRGGNLVIPQVMWWNNLILLWG